MSELTEMHLLCWQIFRDSRAAQSYACTYSRILYFTVDYGWVLQGKIKVKLLRVPQGWQWQPVGWQSKIAKVFLEQCYNITFAESIDHD